MKNNINPHDEAHLWRKLMLIIVIKLVIITLIRWLFIKDNRQVIDDKTTEKHLLSQRQ